VSVSGFTFLMISQRWWTGHRHIRREPSLTAVNDANGNPSESKRPSRVHLTTMGSRRARVDRSSRLPQAASHTLKAARTRVFLSQSATPPQHPYQRSSPGLRHPRMDRHLQREPSPLRLDENRQRDPHRTRHPPSLCVNLRLSTHTDPVHRHRSNRVGHGWGVPVIPIPLNDA
jgi:hypothetical protein